MRPTPDQIRARADKLKDQFRAYSREPFIDILARLTACEPNEEALQQFANNHPDRWIAAMARLSQVAGYHERLEIKGNIVLELHSMGDAQLLEELEKVETKLLELEVDKEPIDAQLEDLDLVELVSDDLPSPQD